MTPLDPPATPAEDAAAAAMWEVWAQGHIPPLTWAGEEDGRRDLWRSYARAALAALPVANAIEAGQVLTFVRGVADMVGDELDAHASLELRDAARAVIASVPERTVALAAGEKHRLFLISREQLARAIFNRRYAWTVGKYADFWEQLAETGRIRWRAGAEAAIDYLAAIGLPVKAVA